MPPWRIGVDPMTALAIRAKSMISLKPALVLENIDVPLAELAPLARHYTVFHLGEGCVIVLYDIVESHAWSSGSCPLKTYKSPELLFFTLTGQAAENFLRRLPVFLSKAHLEEKLPGVVYWARTSSS